MKYKIRLILVKLCTRVFFCRLFGDKVKGLNSHTDWWYEFLRN